MSYASLQDERLYSFEILNARHILTSVRFFPSFEFSQLLMTLKRLSWRIFIQYEYVYSVQIKKAQSIDQALFNNVLLVLQQRNNAISLLHIHSHDTFRKCTQWFCTTNERVWYMVDTKRAS